jgi:hypothetical protein
MGPSRGQLRRGTRTTEVIEHLAAPLYYRLLVRGEPPTEADVNLQLRWPLRGPGSSRQIDRP